MSASNGRPTGGRLWENSFRGLIFAAFDGEDRLPGRPGSLGNCMDPTRRLDRRIAGDWTPKVGGLVDRLRERHTEPKAERIIPGEKLGRSFDTRNTRHIADPWPNAPLLKRVVRYPFALHVRAPQRQPGRDAVPWEALQRETTGSPMVAALAERGELIWGNPLKAVPTQVERLPRHQGVDAWLATQEGA